MYKYPAGRTGYDNRPLSRFDKKDRLTSRAIAKIKRLRREGHSLNEIAQLTGRSVSTVNKYAGRSAMAKDSVAIVPVKRKHPTKRRTNGSDNHYETKTDEETFTRADLIFEGQTAFAAGETKERLHKYAEAAGVPYETFASHVLGFIRATTSRTKLGHTHSMSVLPGETTE